METLKYKDYTIKIIQDEYPESPREWDNLGTMACIHSRYCLGDQDHGLSIDEIVAITKSSDYVHLNLYLYDHSGITMSTAPFSCSWDSGQVGIIFVSREDIRKAYDVKRITKQTLDHVYHCLKAEVKTYDQFLTGDIYGYQIVDQYGEDLDSCWGFYGQESAIDEAKSMIDYYVSKYKGTNAIPQTALHV